MNVNQQNKKNKIIVCVSGAGRSLLNLLKKEKGNFYEIAAVISSKNNCGANDHARAYNKDLFTANFPTNQESTEYLQTLEELKYFLSKIKPNLIVLAGFLRPFPTEVICDDTAKPRIINIHPSLLPKFGGHGMYGNKVHRAVINTNDKESGATVHFVTEEYDKGKVISQIIVPRLTNDTPESLAAKVFDGEKILLPYTIDKILKKKLPEDFIHTIHLKSET